MHAIGDQHVECRNALCGAPLTCRMPAAQHIKPPRRVLYLFNRESTAARKHNAESHSLRADLEWKLGVRAHCSTCQSCCARVFNSLVKSAHLHLTLEADAASGHHAKIFSNPSL